MRIWPLDGSPCTVLIGHTGPVTCLTQLANGRFACGGSSDGTVRVSAVDGSEPTVLTGHTAAVSCLVQLADGRLVSASEDNTLRVLGKNSASLFQRALRPITQPQGRRFTLRTTRRLAILARAITLMKKVAVQECSTPLSSGIKIII